MIYTSTKEEFQIEYKWATDSVLKASGGTGKEITIEDIFN